MALIGRTGDQLRVESIDKSISLEFFFFSCLAVALLALRRSVLHAVHRQTDAAARPLGPSSGARVPFVLQGNSPLFLIHHLDVMNPAGMAWQNKRQTNLLQPLKKRRKANGALGEPSIGFSVNCVLVSVSLCFF